MSKTSMSLIVKFVVTLIAFYVTLALIDNNPWGWILLAALIGTAVNYLVGDLVVLPAYGNIAASIGDGIMAALVAYIISLVVPAFAVSWTALILLAVIIAIAEYFFHQYLLTTDKVAP
ncbi:MAG: DUF2512 family protein [Syntrophomonadaceae bacterium]|nr:DUF2512 family protein [Syntrophomonadaceae bacterium]